MRIIFYLRGGAGGLAPPGAGGFLRLPGLGGGFKVSQLLTPTPIISINKTVAMLNILFFIWHTISISMPSAV